MTITPDVPGARLDAFVARALGVTRSQALRRIERGAVLLNGAPPKKAGVALSVADVICISDEPSAPLGVLPEPLPIDILYADKDIIVVNKPRGMVTHPAAGHAAGTLVNALLHAAGELSSLGGAARSGIVHRLDKDTTGLLVAARNDAAHAALAAQFASRAAGRVYWAVAAGRIKEDAFIVDAPLGRNPKDRKRMAVVKTGGRAARTRFAVLERLPRATLLEARLETGRTHQIRVHLAYAHHPVVGDTLYNTLDSPRSDALLLHSASLEIVHPETGEAMTFKCPPPPDFAAELERLRGMRG